MSNLDNLDIKKQRHCQRPSSQSYGFSRSHVWMWEFDHKESWAPKNWCFWTMVLEKTLESPLDCKEIQPVSWRKSVLNINWKDWCWSWNSNTFATWCEELTHGKDPDAGKDWRQEEKGMTDDEMVGWHIDSMDMNLSKLQELEWQGSLMCYSPWGHKQSDTTERLNWTDWKSLHMVSAAMKF